MFGKGRAGAALLGLPIGSPKISNASARLSAMPGEIVRVEPFIDCGVIARAYGRFICDAAIAAAYPITSAMEMQSQSSKVSAVFFLIRVQAALAASMVSSKPPFK